MVCRKILDAVSCALINMYPILVGWENVEVDIGGNRREDNKSVDKRTGILKACSLDERKNTEKIWLSGDGYTRSSGEYSP